MAISMLKIRRPLGRLIFNMGMAIPGKTVFLIETAPCHRRIPRTKGRLCGKHSHVKMPSCELCDGYYTGNKRISQFPQYTYPIPHSAPFCNRIYVKNGASLDICLMLCSNFEMGQLGFVSTQLQKMIAKRSLTVYESRGTFSFQC